VLAAVQTRDKQRCGSSRRLSNLKPCYDNCIADHQLYSCHNTASGCWVV